MQNYIGSLNYIKQDLTEGEVLLPLKYDRLIIDEHHPSYNDSKIDFCQTKFKYPYLPLYLGEFNIKGVADINVNVLRLIIRLNSEDANIFLPKELLIFKDFIMENINYHRQYYPENKNCFIYLTVRCSTYENLFYKNSQSWHIDGFQGNRIKKHIIEQDVFWSNVSPTQYLLQPMYCEGLNPTKHDINDFFEKQADSKFIFNSLINSSYIVTPYNVHRTCPDVFEGNRVFIRLNFSPVEIEDYTNTENPMLKRKAIFRRDVRDFLRTYIIDEFIDSGFNR